MDRFIVKDAITEDSVWWGKVNLSFDADKFDALEQKIVNYLSEKELYVRDAYACADEKYRINIRVVNEYAWSNMFAYNMFLRPTDSEIKNFDTEWTILNAPGFMADAEIDGTRQHNFAILNFTKKIILIGGTGYTGEIKKGIFSALNFILPYQKNVLAMHCSANTGKDGDTSVFFGLSGTGKTTICKELLDRNKKWKFSISATTRDRRSDEKDGVDYIFMSKEKSDLSKSVFTVCKKRDGNKCPPWSIKAKKISHDKTKKIVYYDNAVLKFYDIPIFYFTKFI